MRSPDELDIEAELEVRFTYRAPTPEKAAKHRMLRREAFELAQRIVDAVPDCRERSLALTALEEVVFWANAGIARRG